MKIHNFNPGPAVLPPEALRLAQEEWSDFAGTGMSVMEVSHRSPACQELFTETEQLLRQLLGVPDGYHVLFLQGGASLQFGMVPMNFLGEGKSADYILTGSWSQKALKEARIVGEARVAATTEEDNFRRLPKPAEIKLDPGAAYVHITSNNTIVGTQHHYWPETGEIPLIADMSSDILGRQFDVSKFGLVYAGAQKNLGPAGVTTVIIRDDMLERCPDGLPSMLDYRTHAKAGSLYNTPPVWCVYMMRNVLLWLKSIGGLREIEQRNRAKARLVYRCVDRYPKMFIGHAEPGSRSVMNITFRLPTEELEQAFLEKAKTEGLIGLKGHRSVGGCRASLYSALPLESAQVLAAFMEEFATSHG